jgi:hypothetical protein
MRFLPPLLRLSWDGDGDEALVERMELSEVWPVLGMVDQRTARHQDVNPQSRDLSAVTTEFRACPLSGIGVILSLLGIKNTYWLAGLSGITCVFGLRFGLRFDFRLHDTSHR